VNKIVRIKFTLTSSAALLEDAYQLAVTHGRSVYDSLYVALSLREKCEMVTADEKLINAIGAKFPNILLLANWS
jgi:predicted nucleic acid-binding protein